MFLGLTLLMGIWGAGKCLDIDADRQLFPVDFRNVCVTGRGEKRENIAMVWLRPYAPHTWSLVSSTSLHSTLLFIHAACHLVLFLSSDKYDKLKISLDITLNTSQGHSETKQLHLYQTQDKDDSSDKTNLVLQTHLFTLGKLFALDIPVCSDWIRKQNGNVIRRW